MPTTKSKTTNSLPQMTGDMGYGLGFFCGCLVGAAATYLAFTPEGKLLKQKIIKEYRTNQQTLTLESLLPEKDRKSLSPRIDSIKTAITGLRQRITLLIEEKPNQNVISKASKSKKKHYFKQK